VPAKETKLDTTVAVILNKLERIEKDISALDKRLDDEYVTRDQFEPVKSVVYGTISVLLLSIVGALVALVVK
jgi:hypothetical protein